ncbi:nascent polypeptide-associated complex protein [Staphylothermus hellenicus]|uniref:Nascent polypeptide-associated complex protein n=1 Tax=Staphylothermus hellenicus (strain DSM 12710 / JCM 10830 / BK20S6-10-b1 / P8) TaxID=591019 RepID=D7DA89_STAHD|nr:nascent polypeptide-associated complex protein [Staphylothermus hellenicus]ADI32685.1 alpha-NAC related protein [Staphylothermus hellenicus DSM 12710]
MFPGISPRDLKRMLKRMGIKVEELPDVREVNILLKDKKIVISSPQIVVMKTGEQTIYQIIGEPREEALEESREEKIEVSEEDIEFIVSQTGVSKEEARKALIKTGGDIAEAILLLQGEK